ncbi:heme a biosynthesis protein-like protein [Amylocarpus encephaloides]|uniref:Protoheme IX farnesyltransferase, mitochondrial n=1 Tax=Amylocarpus encephaloides TaxID=45428 RepID=A0A9P7Y8X1_9HELO|nr:heme a biosynthesis protein-like protein [Amylocarpus encephaloides]
MIIRYPVASALRHHSLTTVCQSCLLQTPKPSLRSIARNFSRASNLKSTVTGSTPRLRSEYFSANGLLERARGRRGAISTTNADTNSIPDQNVASTLPQTTTPPQETVELLPHRRRQAARRAAAQADLVLPPNSSSTLTESASAAPANSIRRLLPILLSLSKPRLSVLVVLTACATYSLYPVPEMLSPSATDTPSLSPLTLLFLTSGTALCAASANTFNMLYEPKWDAMMSRTRNRPLVRKLISTRGAAAFAILSGLIGTTALYFGVNPTVSALGAINIVIYAGMYTPLKRVSVINTWVGAVVGGIPPLMGWAAAAGQSATSTSDSDWKELLLGSQNAGGWLLAALLVSWQFPHFMSLSWSIREEYKNAGYKMLSWTNPARNGRVALRYSLAFFPICVGLCYYGITEWSFAAASTPINAWLVKEAVRFWKLEGNKGSARGLFWASVWHLPVVMILAMVEKKGMWQRVWRAVAGEPDPDGEEEDWEEEEAELVKNALPAGTAGGR